MLLLDLPIQNGTKNLTSPSQMTLATPTMIGPYQSTNNLDQQNKVPTEDKKDISI